MASGQNSSRHESISPQGAIIGRQKLAWSANTEEGGTKQTCSSLSWTLLHNSSPNINILYYEGAIRDIMDPGNCTYNTRLTHWGRDKTNAIFQTTFSNRFSWMKMYEFFIKISLKFVSNGLINDIPALVQIMAWRRLGDKPLSEPMIFSLLTHVCVTRPQWVNWPHPWHVVYIVQISRTLFAFFCQSTGSLPNDNPNPIWTSWKIR